MNRMTMLLAVAAMLLPGAALTARAADAKDLKGLEFYERKVRPILAKNCYGCHSARADKLKAGLSLDTKAGLLRGGERGPAVLPGDARKSMLLRAIRHDDKHLKPMPPKQKLSADQLATLTQWVKLGAPMPADAVKPRAAAKGGTSKGVAREMAPDDYSAKYDKIRREHWAFQPVRPSRPPATQDAGWAKGDIDRFVLAGLEAKGLTPSAPADRRTLIRRLTFDLTGLPPAPEQVEAFVNDVSLNAYEKLVDRLLASPAFGERWGRHWLDVARYGESTGMSRNVPLYYAWRYRDYVIDAFNKDKPFDRFVTEQLAGDLLPARTDAQRDEQLIATGFLAIGTKDLNERRNEQFVMNNVDEQIDVMSRSMLGLTIACARCHDHKFDPIPTSGYYAMAGIFRSTELLAGVTSRQGGREYFKQDLLLPLSGKSGKRDGGRAEAAADQRDAVGGAIVRTVADEGDAKARPNAGASADDARAARREARRKQIKQQLRQQIRSGGEREIRAVTVGVRDLAEPRDCNVLVRGELDERGPLVPRGVIALPNMPVPAAIPAGRSGRIELAQWVTSPKNPLTSRVMVNRVWQHLFGQGIVATSDNFGTSGESPSHPALLDHLAAGFAADGWSVKRAIRRIVLSNTYQQASAHDAAKHDADPENRLLWRMSPRRLEAEAIRDAVLSASGGIDLNRPTGSPVIGLPPVDLGRGRSYVNTSDRTARARSVYLPIVRGLVPDVLDVFDFADPTLVTGNRDVTTVPAQALFMMNSPFVFEQAQAMAARLLAERPGSDAARIDRAYALALGRPPTTAERERTLSFVRSVKEESRGGKGATPAEAWTVFCQARLSSAEVRYRN